MTGPDGLQDWLDEFARLVRARDTTGGRGLFAPDCMSFGTRAEHADDLDSLVAEQWAPTWDATEGFDFLPDTVRTQVSDDGAMVVVLARWASDGVAADGHTWPRRGRCTIVLRTASPAGSGAPGWVAVHTHFSMAPTPDPNG